MQNIALQNKTNFFEKRVSEYSKSGVGDKKEDEVDPFGGMDIDF